MADLQETIRGNVQPRKPFYHARERIVRLESGVVEGNIGAAWPPRGIVVDAEGPAVPPYLFDQSLKKDAERGLPAGGGGGMQDEAKRTGGQQLAVMNREPVFEWGGLPKIEEMRGQHWSFQNYPGATTGAQGFAIGPFSGPAYLDQVRIDIAAAQVAAQDYDLGVRIDFSRNPSLDTFTFVAGSPPTGQSSAEVQFFRNDSIRDNSTGAVERGVPGWFVTRPIQTVGLVIGTDLRFLIALDAFWLKAYMAIDATVVAVRVGGVLRLPS
jgi:hypothetical protein